jgi:acetoin utilization protein AcuB
MRNKVMRTVRDIMTTDVVSLTPQATIRDAMEALSTNHLGGMPVVVGERVVGVVSMSDIVGFMVEDAGLEDENVLDQHTVSELMTYQVFGVAPSTSITIAAGIMRKRGIHRVLVMENEKLVGIVSALDIAQLVSRTGLPGKSGVRVDPCVDDQSPWITV